MVGVGIIPRVEKKVEEIGKPRELRLGTSGEMAQKEEQHGEEKGWGVGLSLAVQKKWDREPGSVGQCAKEQQVHGGKRRT